jgi:hypothetical protein
MKKKIQKLHLNKKTISNLQPMEMRQKMGGTYFGPTHCGGGGNTKNCTVNQNTCNGHNTCQYTCA